MASINTTPLLQEIDSELEENDIHESLAIKDNKPLFKPIEPKDKFYTVYFIFYLLGIVTLLPWNFYVTANDYWMYKFRDTDIHNNTVKGSEVKDKTPLQAEFTSYISVASAVPNLVFLVLNAAIAHRVSANKRILASLLFMLLLMLVTLIFVLIDTDKWQHGFFMITLGIVVLLNVCSAVLSGSVFGIVGNFSPVYITAVIGGQALGGIFAALAEIVSLALGASSTHAALVYFIIGNVTIVISVVLYIVLTKTVFYKYHIEDKFLSISDFGSSSSTTQLVCHSVILKKVWIYGVSMFLVFFFSLSVYPGVTVLIESEGRGSGNKWNDVFFVPTIAYLLFSIGDYVGRITAGRLQQPKNETVVLILSLARFVFIPLMMLCNAQPRHHHWDVVFNKDYEYIIILFLCALSNGYLANLTAILAPRKADDYEKETAAAIMTVFMGIGLALGSTLSLFMVKML
ncbi:equilibrative nucleoside transporter 3-like [Anthonomus grandis grandis]|uniref:equilibrative nucleoside transporter 3-like n=1 Tax=Anthonomus grandis grandis TaxID=2921223 RepID=UPI002165ED65|nr:equilibrative nucleoside transporter 3-like [Anthonomus grandis grandis]